MNFIFLLIALPSLLFAFWTASGLYRRHEGTLPERSAQRKWWLGVCADFSETVGIPVGIVRIFVLFYTPVGLGPTFYFIYYLSIRNRTPLPAPPPEGKPQVTKIESRYYRS